MRATTTVSLEEFEDAALYCIGMPVRMVIKNYSGEGQDMTSTGRLVGFTMRRPEVDELTFKIFFEGRDAISISTLDEEGYIKPSEVFFVFRA